ncbi:MAG: pseudouridine synthase [Campylobacteraceae bacterium 4484_4]|nr:MAG: pseudouridine synthase [Campylobacteraceae bacterium 4484_4]
MKKDTEQGIRLNKYLSHNTKYSRREADDLIKAGHVKIRGKVVTDLATRVQKGDKVFLKGRFVHPKTEFTVIVYHKRKGELVTKKDDRGRKTIYDQLPKRYHHFIPVGRLDYASEGLVLLTDSPDVATALMRSPLERVYYLKIRGEVTEGMTNAMREGLFVENATKGAHPKSEITSMEFAPFLWYKIQKSSGGYTKLKVAINEGKNRELRRFFAYFDAEVVDLKRVEFGGISLDTLPPGKVRFLSKSEYHSLHTFLDGLKKEKRGEL